jgi:hypothetical protein
MPWLIGIDEAGYGPNLGPFVMTAVACQVPARRSHCDLWDLLRTCVRRAGEPTDERIQIADSKVVYSPARGLAELETGALVLLSSASDGFPCTLARCVASVAPTAAESLNGEPWYTGESKLPLVACPNTLAVRTDRFLHTCRKRSLNLGVVRSAIVCAPAFNSVLDRVGTKGAVLAQSLGHLVAHLRAALPPNDAFECFIDKHGGRDYYAATLQQALPDGMIVARQESAERSVYAALGLEREMHFTFEPRADFTHFCVAAASMVSKYLRELLMHEFNRFWKTHVPKLKPTAGYPGDAARFFKDIEPVIRKLGIEQASLWRRK